ncbi:MAG TPA: PQQ-binding-like beta-propeller repeat protein [Bacillota bacterium]|nr:PQQ-binding-like beta-propeller repeat protein [Bacillota bacterium]
MKKAVTIFLALMLLFELASCGGNTAASEQSNSEIVTTETRAPCTAAEVSELINAGDLAIGYSTCEYLIYHQDVMPEDVIPCLNGILGEYRVYKLSGATGELPDEELATEEEINTLAAVLQLHGYTQEELIRMMQGDVAALSAEELATKVAENQQYMVDGRTAYRMPEDGADYLPYFATFEPEVLDEALGVTITAPREITETTGYNQEIDLGTAFTRCALITNNSNKTVQLLSANDNVEPDMTEEDWEMVEGYDASLVIDWQSDLWDFEEGAGGALMIMDLIPMSASEVLEPGESTVVRYGYQGNNEEDYDFITLFSYYVTDGESTELLAAAVMNHIRPSQFPMDTCTITGTVYDEETGMPIPNIGIQISRSIGFSTYANTDANGRFTIEAPAFQFDSTGYWARCSVFVNELASLSRDMAYTDSAYAEECIIVEPHAGESMDLTFALKHKPAQVNYTIQTEYDMKMQAYGVDVSNDIIVTTPFHTTFSEEYRIENSYLHVFDKTGELLFKKPLYAENGSCDISTDGTLVAGIVDYQYEGGVDTAYVWDINGNEVFSYELPYKDNPQLYVQHDNGMDVYSNLTCVQISNDSTMLLVVGEDGYANIVRISDGALISEFWANNDVSHKSFWSPDDTMVYLCASGDLRAIDVLTGELIWHKYAEATLMGVVMTDTCVVTSAKATGVGHLMCSDLATGETLWTLDTGMRCSSMALSHDGKTLFWGTDTSTTNERSLIIDMETGTPLWGTIAGKQAAAFSADDQYIALRSGGNLQLWTVTGEHLYGAIIAEDNNSMSWGIYMSGDCKYIVSFAGGSKQDRHFGVMYALTLDEDTPIV